MGERQAAPEGRFASTWQNRVAGRALRAARLAKSDSDGKQVGFAASLARGLGIDISAAALSNWESGRRSVPAAVLIEAAVASGSSIDDLLSRLGEPKITEWTASRTELSAGGAAHSRASASDLGELGSAIEEQRQTLATFRRELQEQGRMLARMRSELKDRGITLADAPDAEDQDATAI